MYKSHKQHVVTKGSILEKLPYCILINMVMNTIKQNIRTSPKELV
jgi:hypothetical protein